MSTPHKNTVLFRQRKVIRVCLLLIASTSLFSISSAQSGLQLTTDRPTAYYEAGETITFIATQATGTLDYEIFYDKHTPVLQAGSVQAIGNQARITYQLQEPGVINCRIKQQNNQVALAAAVVSPYQIEALEPEPTDFDAFWQTAKNELRQITPDVRLSPLNEDEYTTTFRISFAHINNRRIYGYISIPKGEAPYPAILTLPPFGSAPDIVKPEDILASKAGVIALSISIHNTPPDQQDPNAYEPNDFSNPTAYYDRQAILAGIRAIDYLFTRSDFNGKLGVVGVSQGGGLGLITAGLDNRVDFVAISTATHCQHLGLKYDKASGFPSYIQQATTKNLGESFVESVAEATKYYDAIYFAKRYKGPILKFINYLDDVTAPATEFAAFNQVQGMKILLHSLRRNHQHGNEYWNGRYDFFRQLLPKANHAPWPWNPDTKGYFIDAGDALNVSTNETVTLNGTVQKNEAAVPFPVQWEKISGPGSVDFHTPTDLSTAVNFSAAGTYVLRLTANDYSDLENGNQYYTLMDEVVVTVGNSPSSLNLQCSDDVEFQARPDGKSPPLQWSAPLASNNCPNGNPTITQLEGPNIGQRLVPGTYTVRYQATNACGDTATCALQVVITVAAELQLTCPTNKQFTIPENEPAKMVTWTDPEVISNCAEGTPTLTQTGGPISGSNLTPGIYIVRYAAVDDCGNTTTCSFTITINQSSSVSINCPADISVTSPADGSPVPVSWQLPIAQSTCTNLQPPIQQTGGPVNGSLIEPGVHFVKYEAVDSCGNVAECSFSITITPETILELFCPADSTIEVPADSLPILVSWPVPQVNSNCTEGQTELLQIAGPVPNTLLAEGVYTLTYTVADGCGNSETCSFTITITEREPTGPCNPGGHEVWHEWIAAVNFNGITHESMKEGYANFEEVVFPVTIGHQYRMRLTGNFMGITHKEYWKVWIDFDKDGLYEETEVVVAQRTDEPNLGTIIVELEQIVTIPAYLKPGRTTMRVSMRRGVPADPCEPFMYGEVHDYTVQFNAPD